MPARRARVVARKRRRALEPAAKIVLLLGGPDVVAKVCGCSYTAPYRWQSAAQHGGTGGLIPQRHHRRLLKYAKRAKIKLAPVDFIATP